jgi:2-amino-4-hydroxy-6-hydroxymethyldihydropteridine diphosphokinase
VEQVVLSLGGNLGDRKRYIETALKLVDYRIGGIEKCSQLYETEPWGTNHPEIFLNAAVVVKTDLEPLEILKAIKEIERELGRMPNDERNSPRTIDIDILFYGNLILDSDLLIIPHPRITERNFVLIPVSEILPDLMHPVFKKTISELLQESSDELAVNKIKV